MRGQTSSFLAMLDLESACYSLDDIFIRWSDVRGIISKVVVLWGQWAISKFPYSPFVEASEIWQTHTENAKVMEEEDWKNEQFLLSSIFHWGRKGQKAKRETSCRDGNRIGWPLSLLPSSSPQRSPWSSSCRSPWSLSWRSPWSWSSSRPLSSSSSGCLN